MRIVDLDAIDLFSFDQLSLQDLPHRALVVVGPNGSGKTNVSRLLQIVMAAVERSSTSSHEAYERLVELASGRRIEAAPGGVSRVRLGMACTERWETDLVVRFMRAALFSSLLREAPTNFDRSGVREWVAGIHAGHIGALTTGQIVVDLIDPANGQWSLSYEFDVDGQRFRVILEASVAAGALIHAEDASLIVPVHGVTQSFEVDESRVPAKPFSLETLLPPRGEGRMLVVESGLVATEEPIRAWAAAAGIAAGDLQRRSFGMSWVLSVLLTQGVALLGDLRLPPKIGYSVDETGVDPAAADGSRIPLRLFRLKNGDLSDRSSFAAIQELYERLTTGQFDIQLASNQPASDQSPAMMRISPVVRRSGRDLQMEFAGAGMWEALLLSATLSDSVGRVVVLDEPARNLHPTLQRRLLEELGDAAGQFIVTTHSPYLVPVISDDDTAICRLSLREGVTRAHVFRGAPDDMRLLKALAESADARALVFARGVVLVEGGTELGALPEWFAKSETAQTRGTPDALNVVFFSVDGDPGFGTFVGFLHGLGVPWTIVCDGGAFQFGTSKPQIFKQILKAGVEATELQAIVDSVSDDPSFADMRRAGERYGVFTVAESWESPDEAFEAYIEAAAPGQLAAAAKIVGRSKPRQGRHVAAATDCPPEIDKLYGLILDQLDLR